MNTCTFFPLFNAFYCLFRRISGIGLENVKLSSILKIIPYKKH